MPTLKKAIQDLKQFSKHGDIAEILDDLTLFSKKEDITDERIEGLRKKLVNILFFEHTLNQNPTVTSINIVEKHHFFRSFFNFGRNTQNKDIRRNTQHKDIHVFDAVYNTLIALAEFKPLNDTDPITLDEIKDKNKIFTSTGHQYDINTLIDFHNQRPIEKTDFHESRNNKYILNISINQPFSPRDVAHIEEFIQKKIKSLGKTEPIESVKNKKLSNLIYLQMLSVFSLFCAAGSYFEDKKPQVNNWLVLTVFASLISLAYALSFNDKKIEEQPLLDYKPK